MERIFTALLCLISFGVKAQLIYNSAWITFDDTTYKKYVSIDTTNYHHNIWQIGNPHKTVFTSAGSPPNAIVTDTLNPYPANDTSVFYLKLPKWNIINISSDINNPIYSIAPFNYLQFDYQINTDTNAIATIEMSIDSGITWIDLRNSLPLGYSIDSSYGILYPGWITFELSNMWPHFTSVDSFATVQFRFTFTSNNYYSGKDGWIIDDIYFHYVMPVRVPNAHTNNSIIIYPNPSKGDIYIHTNTTNLKNMSASVFDMNGENIYTNCNLPPDGYLYLSLPNGTYVLKCNSPNVHYEQKIIINR